MNDEEIFLSFLHHRRVQVADIDQLSNSVPSDNFVITLKNAVPKLKRVKHFVDGDDLKFMLFPRENVDKFDANEISFGYETSSFDLIISLG